MNHVVSVSREERETLFRNTAEKCGMSAGIVEKDFWVCWALDYLFHKSPWVKHMAFKGGTSLSKCYNLIERFSEDIDLILDWCLLGYSTYEPWEPRSNTKQDKFNKEVNARAADFLQDVFIPKLKSDFSVLLPEPFDLYVKDDELQTVCFAYPKIFEESAIVNVVRLEIGALAAWTPTQETTITSYAAEQYPQVFNSPSTSVLTVAAERTFWEKVTILHKEAFRTTGNFPPRYSRHYYDLFSFDTSPVKDQAYKNLELLERVVQFKMRFYPSGAARYDLAHAATMKLMPSEKWIPTIAEDYEHMKNMIYGDMPSFVELMDTIQRLEYEINNLAAK